MITIKEVTRVNGTPAILVKTDFSDEWNKVASQMGGKFSREYGGRIFDADQIDQVRCALREIFLWDGAEGPSCTLAVVLEEAGVRGFDVPAAADETRRSEPKIHPKTARPYTLHLIEYEWIDRPVYRQSTLMENVR